MTTTHYRFGGGKRNLHYMTPQSIPPHKQLVPTPLDELVENVLGDAHDKPITRKLAQLIVAITENRHTVFVQFRGMDDEPFEYPVLWRYNAWVSSVDRWKKQKAYSDKLREEGWIREANVKIIGKAICREWQIKPEQANILATRWMRELKTDEAQKKINALGIKLKTTIDEL